jgi:pantetheine-phosphate adenylyltransferase
MSAPRSLTALVPGSFDPIHLGHLDVIDQASRLFGAVKVAVMHNPDKASGTFSPEERARLATAALTHLSNVSVHLHGGLAVQAARDLGADCIVKGVRGSADYETEAQMARTNRAAGGPATLLVVASPGLEHIASRFVREIAYYGGDVSPFVPSVVADALRSRRRGT